MSIEDLKKLGKLCSEDEAVKGKVKELVEDPDGLITYAKGLGLDITSEDLASVASEAKGTGELSEEELEQVAGGVIAVVAAAGIAAVEGITALTSKV